MRGATYIGRPCKHGHHGERYLRGDTCVECQRGWQGNYLKSLDPPPRPEAEIRAEAAEMLTAQLQLQRARWGFI